MNRISERELQEIGRVSFDPPPASRETLAQALVASAYRLSYLFKLWGAVAIAYFVARALLG
jgi:hypothetical protein